MTAADWMAVFSVMSPLDMRLFMEMNAEHIMLHGDKVTMRDPEHYYDITYRVTGWDSDAYVNLTQ